VPAGPDSTVDPASLPVQLHLRADDGVEAVEEMPSPGGPDEEMVLAEVDADEAGTAPERRSGFDGIGTRREARERALALLYEAEQKGLDPLSTVLDALPLDPEPFAAELVCGVSDHIDELDELLGRYAKGWTVTRMPAIDRNLLRIGTWELGWSDVPVAVVISEAVELAKRYSTDDSHTFLNGLLARLATELRAG
jgi:N utilization substance protein B